MFTNRIWGADMFLSNIKPLRFAGSHSATSVSKLAMTAIALAVIAQPASAARNNGGEKVSEKNETTGEWWVDKDGNKLTPYDVDHQSACTDGNLVNCKPAGATGHATKKVTTYVYDPPANRLLSGRITVDYNPGDTVTAGWYGEFGADPLLPAPPVSGFNASQAFGLLQATANPALLTATITIDPMLGRVVFYFDWGSPGFLPSLNLDSTGHYNIAGLTVERSVLMPGTPKAAIFGNGQFLDTLGTDAPTYLLCTGGYCGTVPEPTNWAMLIAGFGLIGAALRINRRMVRLAS